MPELPEVETIRSQLKKTIVGKTITKVVVKRDNVLDGFTSALFRKKLQGRTIRDILRKGKLLIFDLDGVYMLVHLRMSGWFLYGRQDAQARIIFTFSDGAVLNYMDQRTLGKISIKNNYVDDPFYASLGQEITEITRAAFDALLAARKKAKIKGFLLDQRFVSGIGNIYACEGLFRSRIQPERAIGSLKTEEKKKLHASLQKVIQEAIEREGSSINTFKNIYGEKGTYAGAHKVYGRHGQECFVCKGMVKRIVVSGRGTFYCPGCQK